MHAGSDGLRRCKSPAFVKNFELEIFAAVGSQPPDKSTPDHDLDRSDLVYFDPRHFQAFFDSCEGLRMARVWVAAHEIAYLRSSIVSRTIHLGLEHECANASPGSGSWIENTSRRFLLRRARSADLHIQLDTHINVVTATPAACSAGNESKWTAVSLHSTTS